MYREPEFITFTGIDDRTDIDQLNYISKTWNVEWGILLGLNPDAKYPSVQTIFEFIEKLNGRLSFHICGQLARNVLNNNFDLLREKYTPELITRIFNSGHRVQINGTHDYVKRTNLLEVKKLIKGQVIVQTNKDWFVSENYIELFDCSGGRGENILLEKIPKAIQLSKDVDQLPFIQDKRMVGYAGGISHDNIQKVINCINSEYSYWLDIESNVRYKGWFETEKVILICSIALSERR